MKVLVSPTALKGSLTAYEAADAISSALPKGTEAALCPVADGGDGTLECLVRGTGGRFIEQTVTGPLEQRPVPARWGVLGDGVTAVIEMAEAAGLRLLTPQHYDVLHASTVGVGELLRAALDAGYRRILVGLGGSATNDGGMGCLRVLGVRFFDVHGRDLAEGGIHLGQLHRLDGSGLHPAVRQSTITGLVDVDAPLCGPSGAPQTFGPQKGATQVQVDLLDSAMSRYADIVLSQLGVEVGTLPGSGAAGGLAAGLAAFCGTRLTSGIEYILDAVRFASQLRWCDIVLTAEGRIDAQTMSGKAIAGITRRAQREGKPVHALVGQVHGDEAMLCRLLGLSSITTIVPAGMSVPDAIVHARDLLSSATRSFFRPAGPLA